MEDAGSRSLQLPIRGAGRTRGQGRVDRLREGHGRAADQPPQVAGAGEQLATCEAEVGVGQDPGQFAGQARAGQQPGIRRSRQVGVTDLPAGRSG
jgi:hypothetical protein